MPLLTSPIDGSPMRQISRYGIEIDVCPTTGGIWLDKGELEKLMSLLREEALNDQSQEMPLRPEHTVQQRPRQHERYRHNDDDDYDDDRHGYRRGYKSKSKMSKIMDIFDF